MNSLEIIKFANITGDGDKENVYRDLRDIIEEKTDSYTHPDNISTDKVDMTDTIKKYGYSVDDYKKMFGSLQRSEQDVVDNLAKLLKTNDNKGGDDKERKLKILKLKAMALQLQIKMQLKLHNE